MANDALASDENTHFRHLISEKQNKEQKKKKSSVNNTQQYYVHTCKKCYK